MALINFSVLTVDQMTMWSALPLTSPCCFLAGALCRAFSSLRSTYFPQEQVGTKMSRRPKTRTLWNIHHFLPYKVTICQEKKAVNSGLNKSKQADKSAYMPFIKPCTFNLNISTLCYFVFNSNVSCFCDHCILESPPAWCEKVSDLLLMWCVRVV